MGQTLTKEEIKNEIEKHLKICFLSLDQEDLYSKNSISFNLSTASSQKGLVDDYFSYIANQNNNNNSNSNGYGSSSSNNSPNLIGANTNNTTTSSTSSSALSSTSTTPITKTPPTISPSPSSNDIQNDTTNNNSNNTNNSLNNSNIPIQKSSSSTSLLNNLISPKKKTVKYKEGSFEAACYEGDEIFVQLFKKQIPNTNNIKLYEKVLRPVNINQQYKPQPNEYLTIWEYFEEVNSQPLFYDQNPSFTFNNNYLVQEKQINNIENDRFLINKEFIKSVLQSFETFISPLPNSIHFNDISIPPSIDYSSPNTLKIHPNILPIIEIIINDNKISDQDNNNNDEINNTFIIYKKYNYTLDSLLRYSSEYLQKNPKITNFIIYQLVQLMAFLHQKEVVHGDLTPSHIHLSNQMWLGLEGFSFPSAPLYHSPSENQLESSINKWVHGELSNFNYLMILNHLAHRRMGDPMNHPVLPWVMDFSRLGGGWRDLTKTKYRLNKGDEQLDFQFLNAPGGAEKPHHISDILSELTYYSYLARRTPVPLLQRFVRANYEPNEYPATMERLYRWTPDECIPEFFTNPTIFSSIHPDMPDLQIPDWAPSKEDFIQIHMNALESDQVSINLNYWIDLTFGYLLRGEEAIKAKNVALMDTSVPRNSGIVQLFTTPHPKKKVLNNNFQQKHYQFLQQQIAQQQQAQQQIQQQQQNHQLNQSSEEFIIRFNENAFKYDGMHSSGGTSFLQGSSLATILSSGRGDNVSRSDSIGSNSSATAPNVLLSPNISQSPNNNSNGNITNTSPLVSGISISTTSNTTTNTTTTFNNSPSNSSQQTQPQRSSSLLGGKPRTGSGKLNEKQTLAKFLPSLFYSQSIKIEKEEQQQQIFNNSGSQSPTNQPINIDLLSNINSNYIGYGSLGNSSPISLLNMQQKLAEQQAQQSSQIQQNPPPQQQQQTFSGTTPNKVLIHSKSEESMTKKYLGNNGSNNGLNASLSSISINNNNSKTMPSSPQFGSNSEANHINNPPSPVLLKDSMSEGVNDIIEPLPDFDCDLEEFEVNNEFTLLSEDTGFQQHQQNYQQQQTTNTNIFIESIINCESTSLFNYNFSKLNPVYRPLEYNNQNSFGSNKTSHSKPLVEDFSLLSINSKKELSNIDLIKSNDMFSLGCIIAELHQGHSLFTTQTLKSHFLDYEKPNQRSHRGHLVNGYPITSNLPINVKEVVDRLITPNPSDRMQLKELLSSTLFPSYFRQMYHFLCHFHSLHTPEERLTFTLANIGIVTSLPNEAFDLILPFILELFNNPKTMVSALIDLLDPLSQRLGIQLSQAYLLPCLIKLYQRHDDHLLQCHLIQVPMVDMIVSRFGRDVYIHHILPFLLDSVKTNPKENPNHEMLTTALIKISRILGVPLTIRHMMYPLLVALTKPRLQHLSEPLVSIASSLGEQIIVKFYFPSIFTLIQKHSSKASRSESIPCILLKLLQDLIALVKPGLLLRCLFQNNNSNYLASLLLNPPNSSLLLPLAETLIKIATRIGVNNTKNSILKYVQQFFGNYSDLYKYSGVDSYAHIGGDSESTKSLRSIYSPEMTYHLYYKLSRLIGFDVMRAEITDNSLIEHIMRVYIKDNSIKTNEQPLQQVSPYVSDDGLYDVYEETLEQKISSIYKLDDYQDYDDMICDQTFSLQGNIVAQYKEHTASIRSISLLPSEERFMTGGRDNLVKIWSLYSPKSLTTYNNHIHTAHTVHFLSSLVASCDINSLQVWDPESKIRVNSFSEPNGTFHCFEPLTNKYLLASPNESFLSFYDLSIGNQTNEWQLSYQTSQSIRCITTSNDNLISTNSNQLLNNVTASSIPNAFPTWIATGSSSGTITLLDTRTGTVLEQWKSHDHSPITKLIGQGSRYLISCSEKTVIQWDLYSSPPSIFKMWKGFKENITSASLYQNDLVVSSGYKLSSMTLLDDPYSAGYNTFRVDGLKLNIQKQTNIQSIAFLPLHHILLAGNEDGSIKALQ
ncbi:hypothetical protein DICPUDRAFT_94261 [Dictyostelium purpureum]|uniref:BEACH domain-containing protein n=1 Tax=Dictyostelium purpureum TaxID=5786 RepID=F0ZH92_DICPU|nr:uncharacterized protein DICPUDRAFT_94261 [Dictyostelium purpureum]EGC36683.1 hypothetical protein DICPUDRAFT_94261 [Dictyostelium purpureum]|eukprot:XP_003286782.1 hypothetical protein DICPUDRAFT_94261 [Dictyostelium purpureum]